MSYSLTFGPRCNLKYDQCNSNPCQNNGTCFSTTTTLDEYICVCNTFYWGCTCQNKKNIVNLFINHTIEHRGAVIQHFSIELSENDLILNHQQSFYHLPNYLQSLIADESMSGFIIIRLYYDMQVGIYLILTYEVSVSFNATIEVNEKTRCVDVNTLFKTSDSRSNLIE